MATFRTALLQGVGYFEPNFLGQSYWAYNTIMCAVLFRIKPFNNPNETILCYLEIPYLQMRNIGACVFTYHLCCLFPLIVFEIFPLTFKVKVSSKSISEACAIVFHSIIQ